MPPGPALPALIPETPVVLPPAGVVPEGMLPVEALDCPVAPAGVVPDGMLPDAAGVAAGVDGAAEAGGAAVAGAGAGLGGAAGAGAAAAGAGAAAVQMRTS